ncbi:class I adenylate-forming enzyme family protein [Pseudoalteromonas sp. ASV78]|uniref:class I adenylate-forming enzyme family protein n=1 Tax=Pseudoalteromonas sp. ASV78 TaxID=3397851 RepID=UPI0039FD16B3
MNKGIYELFATNVAKNPTKVAVIYQQQRVTYDDLNQQVLKLTSHFLKQGVTQGQRIALFAPNGIEFIVSLLAIAKLGLAAVPLPVSLKGLALTVALKKTPVAKVIAWPTISKLLLTDNLIEPENLITLGQSVASEANWFSVQQTEAEYFFTGSIDTQAPYILTMTSGSTGQPKPIVLSQICKINRAFDATINYYGLTPEDVILVATPMYHSLAQRGVLMPLMLGATTVVLPKFNLRLWLQAIEQHKVSFLFAVSSQLVSLIQNGIEGHDLSSLRCLVSSSAVLDKESKQSLLSLLSCRLHECYGASEVGVVTDFAVSKYPRLSGSVGRSLPFVDVKVTGEHGQQLAAQEVGEICCKTTTGFSGYHKLPEKTREAYYLGDFFKTGDLGYLDEQGYLYYVGRKKELISSGGINVYPQDIEAVIKMHPDIEDCVAFSIPDKQFGEIIKVVYTTDTDSFDETELKKLCLQQLTDYQQPRVFQRIDILARSSLGKILRQSVKEQFS